MSDYEDPTLPDPMLPGDCCHLACNRNLQQVYWVWGCVVWGELFKYQREREAAAQSVVAFFAALFGRAGRSESP